MRIELQPWFDIPSMGLMAWRSRLYGTNLLASDQIRCGSIVVCALGFKSVSLVGLCRLAALTSSPAASHHHECPANASEDMNDAMISGELAPVPLNDVLHILYGSGQPARVSEFFRHRCRDEPLDAVPGVYRRSHPSCKFALSCHCLEHVSSLTMPLPCH
jgi:hypothetical protein